MTDSASDLYEIVGTFHPLNAQRVVHAFHLLGAPVRVEGARDGRRIVYTSEAWGRVAHEFVRVREREKKAAAAI